MLAYHPGMDICLISHFYDSIDYATTCYNFNLKNLSMLVWKNIYLSKSYFDFKNDKDDFMKRKAKQY